MSNCMADVEITKNMLFSADRTSCQLDLLDRLPRHRSTAVILPNRLLSISFVLSLTMHSFPTLKLPWLAQINVIDNMDNEDIFVLSLVSNRTKYLATAARKSIDELIWSLDSTGDYTQYQEIHTASGPFFCFPMLKSLEEARETEKLEEWTLNGQLIPMYRAKQEWFMGKSGEDHYELMDMLSAHILEVFRCPEFSVSASFPAVPEELFVFKYTRRFSSVTFDGEDQILPSEDLKFALEQLEIRAYLAVDHKVPGFRWSGPLRMETLDVEHAKWITFEAFINNECRLIRIFNHSFTSAQLNDFVKKWIAGGLPKLTFCKLDSRKSLSRSRVLQGIQTEPHNPENSPDRHPVVCQSLAQGVDIRRNDGIYATVVVDEWELVMGL